jgi:hypothetical protein
MEHVPMFVPVTPWMSVESMKSLRVTFERVGGVSVGLGATVAYRVAGVSDGEVQEIWPQPIEGGASGTTTLKPSTAAARRTP